MISYILCENEKEFRKKIRKQIEDFMLNNDEEYQILEFENYNGKFEKAVQKEMGLKVYFLDIKTDYGSGIDAARYIREDQGDWTSLILILTAFAQYRYEALSTRLFLLDFISKIDECTKKVEEALEITMKHYGSKERSLNYEYNYKVRRIDCRDIIYIAKEQDSKRSEAHTTYGIFKIPMSLNEIMEKIDERFFRAHKSMIVNLDKIATYDIKSNTVTFENGQTTNLVARNKRKELVERVTNAH